MGFPGGASGKEPSYQHRRCKRCQFDSWVGKIPWRRAWQPTPIFMFRESHGQRSLEGYSPWNHRVGQDWSDLAHARAHQSGYKGKPTSPLQSCITKRRRQVMTGAEDMRNRLRGQGLGSPLLPSIQDALSNHGLALSGHSTTTTAKC